MKHISVYLLFAIAIPSFCCADVTKLSSEDRKVLQGFIAVSSGSTFPEDDAKENRGRRSPRFTQWRLGLTTEPIRALANALRTTRFTFIVSVIL
jgi:hypothetical protein